MDNPTQSAERHATASDKFDDRPAKQRPKKLCGDEWMIVGMTSKNTLLVRGGDKPIVIRVSHSDSEDLFNLLAEANAGIAAIAKAAGAAP